MDQALLSTISALAGTVVGGVTSFTTSWINQASQARAARITAERERRQELYGRFLDEVSRLYSHAVTEQEVNWANLVDIFALRGRILLQSSEPVAEAANDVIKALMDLYIGPKRTAAEVRQDLEEATHDPMKTFAHACRAELRAIR